MRAKNVGRILSRAGKKRKLCKILEKRIAGDKIDVRFVLSVRLDYLFSILNASWAEKCRKSYFLSLQTDEFVLERF